MESFNNQRSFAQGVMKYAKLEHNRRMHVEGEMDNTVHAKMKFGTHTKLTTWGTSSLAKI